MFKVLLLIHVISVMVWFGGAFYERFYILPKLKKAKGTELEMEYAKMILATENMFKIATVGVLLTGILMTIAAGYGFFELSWLGVKQMIASVMLLFFIIYIVPRINKYKVAMKPSNKKSELLSPEGRSYLFKFYTGLDVIHVGVLVNVVLALWKPFF